MGTEELLPVEFNGCGIVSAVRVSGYKAGGIWHAPCPKCGGKDRVFLIERSKFTGLPLAQCRQCGTLPTGYRWTFGKKEDKLALTDEEKAYFAEQRRKAAAEQELAAKTAQAKFASDRPWLPYVGGERVYWKSIGIPDEWQDEWQLGYCPERRYSHEGEIYCSPAYTIPKFAFGGAPVNLDYRLTKPEPGAGKYRPQGGLPPAAFINFPQRKKLSDEVFVLEGSKKAMVCSMFLHANVGYQYQQVFIGIPSQNSWADVPEMLGDCGRVWYLPDPDAITSGWADAFALAVGEHCRIVEFPEKPDDMITEHGVSWESWAQAFRYARPGRFRG